MTVKVLGGVPHDSVGWFPVGSGGKAWDSDIADASFGPNNELFKSGGSIPVAGKHSDWAFTWGVLIDHPVTNAFPAPTKRYRVYNWWAKLGSIVGAESGTTQFWFTSHHDSEGSPNGAVRLKGLMVPFIQRVNFSMAVQTGAGWIGFGPGGAGFILPDADHHLWQLQVDTTSKRARILRDGVEYVAWTSNANIDAAGCLGTSGLGGLVTSGKTTVLNIDHDSMFVTEGDDEADILGTDYAVWAVPPNADVDGGLWTPTQAAADKKFRTLDDPYDYDPQPNDYLSGTGAVDQMFTLPDYDSGTVDAVGVAVLAITPGTFQPQAAKVLAAFGGGAITAYDIVWNVWDLVPGAAKVGYAQLDPPPAGASVWTRADFNNLRIGLRGTAAITGKVYGMYACVVGRDLSKPPKAAWAPNMLRDIREISLEPSQSKSISLEPSQSEEISLEPSQSKSISLEPSQSETISLEPSQNEEV